MSRATPLPPDERRAALIAATEPLLEQFGRDVSTRQIAQAACVAEGTIFRAFATKEALIDAVLEDVFDVQRTCDELAAIDRSLDLEGRMVAAVGVLQARLRRVFALFHSMRIGPQHDRRRLPRRGSAAITTGSTPPSPRCWSPTPTGCGCRRPTRPTRCGPSPSP